MMKAVKAALYARLTGDPTLMNRLGNRGPYLGRFPKDAPHSRTVAAIAFSGETLLVRGDKEQQTYTLNVIAYSHDLVMDVLADLDRLLHPSAGRHWNSLTLTQAPGAVAKIRREAVFDVPDPDSELWQISIRYRVLFARAVA